MISETLRNVALRTITVRKNFSMITDDKVSNFFVLTMISASFLFHNWEKSSKKSEADNLKALKQPFYHVIAMINGEFRSPCLSQYSAAAVYFLSSPILL